MINYYDDKKDLELVGSEGRTVAIYGAGKFIPYGFKDILPRADYFIDRNADAIKQINNTPVVTIEQFQRIKSRGGGVDFVITASGEASQNEIVKLLIQLYKSAAINIFCLIPSTMRPNQYLATIPEYIEALRDGYNHIPEAKDKQYIADTVNMLLNPIVREDRIEFSDHTSKYFNSSNGIRETVKAQQFYKNKIYMFGNSCTVSVYNEDKETISSHLQHLLDINNYSFEVDNYGIYCVNRKQLYNLQKTLERVNIKQNDIVFFMHNIDIYSRDKDKVLYSVSWLKDIQQYCLDRGCKFYIIKFPRLVDRKVLTELEEIIIRQWPAAKLTLSDDKKAYQKAEVAHPKDKELENLLYTATKINNIPYFDFEYLINEKYPHESFFVDQTHFHSRANKRIATEIYEILQLSFKLQQTQQAAQQYFAKEEREFKSFILTKYHENEWMSYIKQLKEAYPQTKQPAAAIVVNCNPFTNGHKYLIETAAQQTEKLYVFVVEEDKSVYTFKERYSLVKQNLAHLKNVTILPSGKFIISQITFAEYFNKDDAPTIDVANDLTIFAKEIAPVLNITKRFVGEEPYCQVTNAYNLKMKEILPQYGIELIEIPRQTVDGHIISASNVRECIKTHNYELLQKLVPTATLDFLSQKHNFNN
ncbi:MAG: hypothetical protein ATN34_00545 [Epulopiscium sp. Nele67-Bin002]|nr:MAG: hypothetical protein ATN34_00545 [Epulopiscium sp. Nele67-Bin002]